MSSYQLRLFVTGSSGQCDRAIANLRRVCEEELGGRYEIEVIDVLEKPEVAEQERIIATPTLIKVLPPPLARLIGDFSDTQNVLLGLDLAPRDKRRDG